MHLTKEDIANTPKVKRLNIINSITGIKPANLIGSKSGEHGENLAIFSSVVHLSSNPALIGFILRPSGEIPRNTYQNILELPYYTINQIPVSHVQQAHYTSAKFEAEISEFETCAFTPEYLADFPAPFVKESAIKIGVYFQEEIPIPMNKTSLIIGEIQQLFIPDEIISEEGYINLEQINAAGIGGLNNYYSLKKEATFPYARANEVPDFK